MKIDVSAKQNQVHSDSFDLGFSIGDKIIELNKKMKE